jgi:RsiW-degrading membrane proteinase PrsW (M82 family)
MDGVVYGSLLGVGMALFETWIYAGGDASPGGATLAREVVRIYGHMTLGGIAGAAAGVLRSGLPVLRYALVLYPASAMALHFLIDLGSLHASLSTEGPLAGTLVALGGFLIATLLHGGLTVLAAERSRMRFDPGSARRILGWPFELLLRRWSPETPPPADGPRP